MNKIKFLWFYLLRFAKRYCNFKKILLLSSIILLLFLSTFLLRQSSTLFCPIVSEGIIGLYNESNLPTSLTNLLSNPLIVLDKEGRPIGKLVDNINITQNNTEYFLNLKKDLYWNDGTKIKSSDIKINLPDTEISYPNDLMVKIKLADSFAPFLTLVTNPVFKNQSLVGTGNYKITHLEKSRQSISKLILEPIRKENCTTNPIISIRFYKDEQTAKTAFNLGEVDVLLLIQDLKEFETEDEIIIKKIQNYSKLAAVFYNTKDPILDKNFRKALNFATNIPQGEDIAKTSIPPTSWAFNTNLKNIHGDAESAKTALSKIDQEKIKPLTLTTTPLFADLAEKITQDWKKIGIESIVRVESGIPQNFQILLTSVPIPHDPDQYTLWHSTQDKTNLSKYSSPRVDKDLEDGRKIDNEEKREEKYWDFQKILQDDPPATFLYFPKINVVLRKKIENNLNKILPLQIPT